MGSRARQLAMAVIYPSPLLVLCDAPKNCRNQPGIEFLRAMPTVWDESVVLSGEVGKSIVVARRSGDRWYLAAMNGEGAAQLAAPLRFLGIGNWTVRAFADQVDPLDYQAVVETTIDATAASVLPMSLSPGGGFAAIIRKQLDDAQSSANWDPPLPAQPGPAN
jgi:alpha-glucosidase